MDSSSSSRGSDKQPAMRGPEREEAGHARTIATTLSPLMAEWFSLSRSHSSANHCASLSRFSSYRARLLAPLLPGGSPRSASSWNEEARAQFSPLTDGYRVDATGSARGRDWRCSKPVPR